MAAVVSHDWEDDIAGTLYAVVKYNGVPFVVGDRKSTRLNSSHWS